jgi:hypothetical protein
MSDTGFPLVVLQFQLGCCPMEIRVGNGEAADGDVWLELVRPFQDVTEFRGKVQPVLDLTHRQQEHRQAAVPQGSQRPQVPEEKCSP